MGLDCSHGAFHGSYGTFGAWRDEIWSCVAEIELPYSSPIFELLNHSDCDGEIAADHCDPIANELLRLFPYINCEQLGRTAQFIAGLHAAAYSHEPLEFH
jgi:hypothetical protein